MNTRLAQLRRERNMSAKELGEKLHISDSAIYTYEHDTREMPYSVLLGLAEFFGCSVDYLLGSSNVRHKQESLQKDVYANEFMELTQDLTDDQKRCVIEIIKLMKDHFS